MVFNQVSVDGYFVDAKGDMSWAHKHDPEWLAFVEGNASGEGSMLFGRVTYEMMAGYWPSPSAAQNNPQVAARMNSAEKMVVSNSLTNATWTNTRVIHGDPAEEVRKLKQELGQDIVMFGSGRLVATLAEEGLIDEYQIVVNPIVLGSGRTMFEGVKKRVALKLAKTRAFGNGNVVLWYERG